MVAGKVPFRRQLGLLAGVYICVQAVLFGIPVMHRGDFVAEQPGYIERDVTKLGGPCMAIEYYELHKYGPLRIGKCWVRYTNTKETTAVVIFHIFRDAQWASVTAETMTDDGPLASLNWRVVRTKEIAWYDPRIT